MRSKSVNWPKMRSAIERPSWKSALTNGPSNLGMRSNSSRLFLLRVARPEGSLRAINGFQKRC